MSYLQGLDLRTKETETQSLTHLIPIICIGITSAYQNTSMVQPWVPRTLCHNLPAVLDCINSWSPLRQYCIIIIVVMVFFCLTITRCETSIRLFRRGRMGLKCDFVCLQGRLRRKIRWKRGAKCEIVYSGGSVRGKVEWKKRNKRWLWI